MKSQRKKELVKDLREEIQRRTERSAAFQRTFTGKDGNLVLEELKKMKRGFDADPYVHAFNAGIQRVLDFIDTAMNQDVEGARKILDAQARKK